MIQSQGLSTGYWGRFEYRTSDKSGLFYYRASLRFSTVAFIIYYFPMFIMKMTGLDISGTFGKIMAVTGITVSTVPIIMRRYKKRELLFWGVLLILSVLTIITTSKFTIFFSVFTLFLLQDITSNQWKIIIKWLLIIGSMLLAVVLVYYATQGSLETRYMNGSFVKVSKRPNFIYSSFFMVVNLYLLLRKRKRIISFCILYIILGYAMYRYTGSRSGYACVAIETVLLILINKHICKSKIVRGMVTLSPIIIFAGTYFINWAYGVFPFASELDLLLQNRLRWGKLFISNYHPKLLGQEIYQSYAVSTYQVLDNAYLSMLVIYGLVFIILWIVLNIACIKGLLNENKYCWVAIVLSYLFYGMTEVFPIVSFISVPFLIYWIYLKNFVGIGKYSDTRMAKE